MNKETSPKCIKITEEMIEEGLKLLKESGRLNGDKGSNLDKYYSHLLDFTYPMVQGEGN